MPKTNKTSESIITFFIIVILLITAPAQAQDAAQNAATKSHEEIWQHRQQLQRQLIGKLGPIVKQCQEQGDGKAVEQLSRLLISRDPQRQYIFLPPENKVGEERIDGLPEELRDQVDDALSIHADHLLQFARELAEQGLGCAAIQNLNEVLFFDPNHEAARRALGHRIIDVEGRKTWRVKSDRLKIKPATKKHPDFDWPSKQYLVVSTTHFKIASRANEEQTRHLAQQLELWHDVWRQVFFSYVGRAKNITRHIDGVSKPGTRNRKYKVVFFASKQEYVDTLSQIVPGIEVSTGYYDDQQTTSFFYASDDRAIEDTWRHELTHQLFQESRRSVASPFEKQHLWLGEGIAMYFESLIDNGEYSVVGGFDARRLQYARLRRLKEQFRQPLAGLANASKKQFQTMPDLAKVYSQSAGLTHYLMDSEFGAMQEPLIEFLRLSYQGKLKSGTFEKLIGRSFAEIEAEYDQFLRVDATTLASIEAPQARTELCLAGAKLESDSLLAIGQCKNLKWLDLSACDVRDARLEPLRSCTSLRQLFLTGAQVNVATADVLADLTVVELDLSGSNLTDKGLLKIIDGSRQLRALNIAGTKVTSHSIKTLASQRPEIKVVSNFNKRMP